MPQRFDWCWRNIEEGSGSALAQFKVNRKARVHSNHFEGTNGFIRLGTSLASPLTLAGPSVKPQPPSQLRA